ncbi:hypothetical protein B0H17DRAFT_1037840 [Mycena rosella]|uniref:Uncharacterized protein n=1 Tax=Mycena rosella TaxID=1033263 RepID=A0AAD7M883_MYCRO|nr:hypothetical protein B0H17DRAFT_1037840 [Mycena rosella]
MNSAPSITIAQAQAVVDKHFTDPAATIVTFKQVAHGFSHTPGMTTYLLDLALGANVEATHSSFLVVSNESEGEGEEAAAWAPNALPIFPQLISAIRSNTSIPIADPALDASRVLLPYVYLLTPPYALTSLYLVSLPHARATGLLTAPQLALIDLQLGTYLGQLHAGAQNDWFGRPTPANSAPPPPAEPYDWQATFAPLLEALLDAVPTPHAPPLRAALARALAAFLFADADTPSLVWLTGSADDVFLAFTPAGAFSAFALLPAVPHALWGDPLLEAFFAGAGGGDADVNGGGGGGPSAAFWEGYRAARGADTPDLLLFPRQRTKRLWYDVFLALVVLRERRGVDDDKTRWAHACLETRAALLKDAPCN